VDNQCQNFVNKAMLPAHKRFCECGSPLKQVAATNWTSVLSIIVVGFVVFGGAAGYIYYRVEQAKVLVSARAKAEAIRIAEEANRQLSVDAKRVVPMSQSPTPAPPTPPDSCGDRQIAANLQDRFSRDEDLKREAIQVDVANKTVILSGTVSSALARNYAVDMVSKNGCPVASVVNNLKIDSDKMIASRVQQAFAEDPTLRAQHIQVDVSHGNVVLSGSVTENLMRTVAASTAGQIHGAATVTNNLRVQPNPPSKSAPDSPSWTTTELKPAPNSPPTHGSLPKVNLTGRWVGTFETCAQGHADITVRITESAPDDIMALGEIAMPNASPGTFTSHGILNTINSFLSLQFSGWQHQPPGLTVGDIGGYVTYVNQRPAEFTGIIRQPGCGKISLKKE